MGVYCARRALVAAALGQPAEGIEQRYPWLVGPTSAVVNTWFHIPFVADPIKDVSMTLVDDHFNT